MCTAIKVDYEDGCIMGRTMDFESPLNYNVVYLPRKYNLANDLMGNKLYSKYRTLGVSFENRSPLKDGINENGLIGITNDFLGFNLYDNEIKKGKINISSLNYLNYALSNYKSVEELIEDLSTIHISTKDYKGEKTISPDFHFMFTDATKRCVVVEPKRKELVYYDNPYNVMTNSPDFESHIRRLNEHLDLDNLNDFNSSKNLPGGYDPFSRFIKAFYLNKMNVQANNYKEAFSHFYNIMGAMVMPEGFVKNKKHNSTTHTRYICGYNTENKLLTIKSHVNPIVYKLGFKDIEDKDIRQEFFLDLSFEIKLLK